MAQHVRVPQLQRLAAASTVRLRPQKQLTARCFSVLNRPSPNYEGHIPLTVTERLGLAIGSGLGSFLDPRRGGTYTRRYYLYIKILTTQISSRHLVKLLRSHISSTNFAIACS